MTKSTNEFVLGLIKIVADLRHIYDEHIEDYDDLLPHVFFGDLTRYVINLYEFILEIPIDKQKWSDLDKILMYLENGMSGDDENVRELIVVSFLENFDITNGSLRMLEERFGPNLKRELKVIRGA